MNKKQDTKETKKKKPTQNKKIGDAFNEGPLREIKIRVVGIGGGGGSIISEVSSSLKRVLFAAANTDSRALHEAIKRKKIKGFHFGEKLTGGLGTGMDADLGKKAAEDSIEEIKDLLKEQDITILVASLGGGTGSGALSVFASAAREMGNLVYGIFTLPFSFEGERKMSVAKKAVKESAPYLNAITIFPNDKIFEVVDKNTPLKEALSKMNKTLAFNLEGLMETIYENGLINIDFADVRTVLDKRRGSRKLAYLNTLEADLQEGAEEIVKRAISNPLYPYAVDDARGVLFNITGGEDIGLTDISSISENISRYTNTKAKIIIGITQKKEYRDKVKIALLATGCGTEFFYKELEEKEEKKTQAPKKNKKKKKQPLPKEEIKEKDKDKEKEIKKEEPNEVSTDEEIPKKEVRRTAIDVKERMADEEREILEEEEKWEKPSFLRRGLNNND